MCHDAFGPSARGEDDVLAHPHLSRWNIRTCHERDVLVFDLGAGSLANFSGLMVPITSLKTAFLSHLHGDHVADYVTLMSSYVKMGRLDPVEAWGGDSDEPALGIEAFVEAIDRAMAWDLESMRGYVPIAGAHMRRCGW
jgi:ribonuclease Z